MKAFKCQNIYYNTSGAKVLDLSKYGFVNSFSDGLAWVSKDEENKDGEIVTWNILVDTKGKEVYRFKSDEIAFPEKVENESFLYSDAEDNKFRYILAEKRSEPIVVDENNGEEEISGLTIGDKEKSGIRYIYSQDESPRIVGFINAAGEVFYKRP
jgi:hypothetical protein